MTPAGAAPEILFGYLTQISIYPKSPILIDYKESLLTMKNKNNY